VGPEHRVSTNKEKWIPAKDVPDLKMKWTARYPDGTSYGPVSICAMAYLVARGSVDRRSEVINLSTGQRCSAEDLLRPEVKAFVDYEN
jgi:hypothetical protein